MNSPDSNVGQDAKTEAPRDPEEEYNARHTTVAQVHRVITQGITDVISDTAAIVKQLPAPIRDAVAVQILTAARDRLNFELDAGNEAFRRLARNNQNMAAEAPSADRYPRTRY